MSKKIFLLALAIIILTPVHLTYAEQAKVYRVGVIHQGGPYKAVVDGLRDGLRQLGYEEGKQLLLEIRDTKSDPKLVEEAARTFEPERINLIYAVTTSVVTPVKNVTSQIPNCFFRWQRPRRQRTRAELWETWRKDLRAFSIRPRISRGSGWKF
jgi:putative tryptophan/tyrosine transport system substrate-binding protein